MGSRTPVGTGEVDAKAADFGGEQEHKDTVVVVEVIHQPRARADRG